MLLAIILSGLSVTPVLTLTNYRCSNEYQTLDPKYYLIEKCHRSTLGIASFANYSSLASCQRLGIEKKGLAINFRPPGVKAERGGYSCEVLKCAEADGGLSLVNDTSYDYYSLYARPLPDVNSTCVPAIGMFHLLATKFNYTEAQLECGNRNAVLADVTSEQRTDAIAQLLAGVSEDVVLVGLRRGNGTTFGNNRGDTLDCTTYRAWAPGHPRRPNTNHDCTILTRHRTWMSTSCSKRYPALCELNLAGPYIRGSIFASKIANDTKIIAAKDSTR